MNIYLVRHGETLQNIEKVFYGSIDCELTEKGLLQCEKLKNFFNDKNIDMVYLSTMKRTLDTTKNLLGNKFSIMNEKNKVVKDSRINERDFGDFEGKDYDTLLKEYPNQCKIWQEDWIGFIPPKGESYRQLYDRVVEFFEEILNKPYNNVLVVAHSGVIRAIYSYIMDKNMDLFWKFASKNGDVSIIKYEYGNLFIDGIIHNDLL